MEVGLKEDGLVGPRVGHGPCGEKPIWALRLQRFEAKGACSFIGDSGRAPDLDGIA